MHPLTRQPILFKRYFTGLVFLMFCFLLIAQTPGPSSFTVQGVVSDSANGETLIGVNIYIKDLKTGTVSDTHGKYALSVPPGKHTLVFSYVGYNQKKIPINVTRNQTLNVQLGQTQTNIAEVQITGQRKFFGDMDYGRDIPSIDAKVISRQNENNASDILHARLAGVWATKTSGAPGDHEKIRIRGQASFFSSAEPLYVVDGVPVPIVNLSSLGIADLNIHDIASVTVLKSASATAIYGFQGANGVVLIDTKQGGEKNEINFTVKTGVKWFNNFYPMMSSREQIASVDSAYKNIGFYQRVFYPEVTDTLCNTNWQKAIFKPGLSQEYQLSGSGTKNKLKYYLSGNYSKQGGIIPRSSYSRYTFLTRLSREFWKKLALGISYRGSVQDNLNNQDEYKGNRLLFEGINKSPSLECTPDSLLYNKYNNAINRIYYNYFPLYNPESVQSIINNNNRKLNIYSNSASFFARLKLSNHLNLNVLESFMYHRSDYDSRFSGYTYNSSNITMFTNLYLKSKEDVILFNHQANLSYHNSFGKHTVNFVLAYRFYKDNLWWQVDSMNNSLPEHYYLKNSMASYGPKGSVLRAMGSYIGNLSYNYHQTYFISLVANESYIKEGLHIHYYHLFPSFALSWDLAQEKPLHRISWLDHLSLYTNWGESGNYPLNGLANDLYESTLYTNGTGIVKYPSVLQLANHYLRHENTTELDYGLKSSFFHQRITISTAQYKKHIDNLIVQRDIPYYYGGGKQYVNVGSIAVNGVELGIEAVPIQTRSFAWDLRFNYSTSKQRVTKLLKGKPMVFDDQDILMPEFIIKQGESLGNIYGYKNLGKWTAADETAQNKLYLKQGGMKYLNADSTNKLLNNNDKVVIGNSIPKFTWNLTNSFQYKNFSLDFTWYCVWGVQKFNETRAATMMAGNNPEINHYINDSLSTIMKSSFYQSSVFIDNASFIRLKDITLTYNPAKTFPVKIRWKFSLSLENMITLTHYPGYDPEATIFTDNNF